MPKRRMIVRGPIFFLDDDSAQEGAMVRIEREGELIQIHQLTGTEPYRRKSDGRMTTVYAWTTRCAECGTDMEYKCRNLTKDLRRRCTDCKELRPYNPEGWSQRARNRYVRILPWIADEEGAKGEAPAWIDDKGTRLVPASLSEAALRQAAAEERWRAIGAAAQADEIDPASLF